MSDLHRLLYYLSPALLIADCAAFLTGVHVAARFGARLSAGFRIGLSVLGEAKSLILARMGRGA